MESLWAPKQIEQFLGMAAVVVPVVPSAGGREKGTSHLAYVFVSRCLRIDQGKVWRPNSFPVSELV
jgi:hypothetical protein